MTSQLSRLADAVVQTALEIVAGRLDIAPEGFVVIAMGKLGGGELNYSSDIDLLFVCVGMTATKRSGTDEARNDGGASASSSSWRSPAPPPRASSTGSTCGCDPGAASGRSSPTAPGYLKYLREHARLWEKQALLRARPVAGDLGLGHSAAERGRAAALRRGRGSRAPRGARA